MAAECLELPSGLTSREPCPLPPLTPTPPVDELVADVEVVDVVSCRAEVDTLVGTLVSVGTIFVLVT
jgi:hypothetical protein